MGILRLELEHMFCQPSPREVVWPKLQKFLHEMNQSKSAFFDLPEKTNWDEEWAQIQPILAKRIPEIDTFLHLGIGGSGLGAETVVRALGAKNAPTFHFLDNIDPDALWNILETANPSKTLLYVVTKSGTTAETLAQFTFLFQWLESKLGFEEAKKHLVFCTDPKEGALRGLANQWEIPCFSIPPTLGGRFSVLSAVGLFPALVAGIDPKMLLKGAHDYRNHFLDDVKKNHLPECADLAYRLVDHYKENSRNITVLMPYSQRLKTFGLWYVQLWAESLGKKMKGLTPLASVGATDQHSILQLLRDGPQDKVVGFIEIQGFDHIIELKWKGPKSDAFESIDGITMNQLIDAELNATRQVMTNNRRPHYSIQCARLSAHILGQLFFFYETLTAITGYLFDIDPFDQPGVEEGKKLTRERLQACKKT